MIKHTIFKVSDDLYSLTLYPTTLDKPCNVGFYSSLTALHRAFGKGGSMVDFNKKAATTLRGEGKLNILRYHNTDVVTHNPAAQTIKFNTDGWRTSTTKRRMNEYCESFKLPIRIFQKNYDWRVEINGELYEFVDDKEYSYTL